MKKLIQVGIVFIFLGIVFMFKDDIIDIYNHIVLYFDKSEQIKKNEYFRDYDFKFVQTTSKTKPESKQDIYNLYYTIMNSGATEYSFNCDPNYKECLNDVREIANNRIILSDINNLVHPYNSFKNIATEYTNSGKVTIIIEHTYSDNDIKEINEEIDNVINSLNVNNNLSDVEKIKIYHNYIIENSKYDSDRSDRNIINYRSDIAYGPLIEGYGICGGYSDSMQLFLEKLGLKNYKISSNNHVWNAVLINGNWLHLDLTWDDPITSNGTNIIDYNFFLINTKRLLELEQTQHNFDQTFYKELAN